jgi:hypothetical protein
MTGNDLLATYLDELFAALPGSRRARRDAMVEMQGGLLDAVETKRQTGLPMAEAVKKAIAEFGSAREVVAAYRPELAVGHARRVALTILASGSVVAMAWAVAAVRSHHFGIRPGPPWHSAGLTSGSNLVFHLAIVALLLAGAVAVSTVVTSGRLTRWRPCRPKVTATRAAAASFAAAAADVAVMSFLATQAISAPGSLSPIPVAVAGIATAAQLALARRAVRDCLSARAALA